MDWRSLDSSYHSSERSETRTSLQPISGLAFALDLASMEVKSGLKRAKKQIQSQNHMRFENPPNQKQ